MKRINLMGLAATLGLTGLLSNTNKPKDYFPSHQSALSESTDKAKATAVEESLHVRAKKEHSRELIAFHSSRGKRPSHITKAEWKRESHYLFFKNRI